MFSSWNIAISFFAVFIAAACVSDAIESSAAFSLAFSSRPNAPKLVSPAPIAPRPLASMPCPVSAMLDGIDTPEPATLPDCKFCLELLGILAILHARFLVS